MISLACDAGGGCGGWSHSEAGMLPEACDAGGGCGGLADAEACNDGGGWANPEATNT